MLSTFLFITEGLINCLRLTNSDICLVLITLLLYSLRAFSMFFSLLSFTIIILKNCEFIIFLTLPVNILTFIKNKRHYDEK